MNTAHQTIRQTILIPFATTNPTAPHPNTFRNTNPAAPNTTENTLIHALCRCTSASLATDATNASATPLMASSGTYHMYAARQAPAPELTQRGPATSERRGTAAVGPRDVMARESSR